LPCKSHHHHSHPHHIRSMGDWQVHVVCVCGAMGLERGGGGGGRDSHSMRLFWRGVPVRITLLRVLMEFMALETADASFFRMWPSSQITKSGPVGGIVSRQELVLAFLSSHWEKERTGRTNPVFICHTTHPTHACGHTHTHADGGR